MRFGMLSLFVVLAGCGRDAADQANDASPRPDAALEAPGPDAATRPDAGEPPVEPPPVEAPPVEAPPVEEPPVEEPPVEEPPAEGDFAECFGRCEAGIRLECQAVMEALDPSQREAFGTCFRAAPCDPDQARKCLDSLSCDAEALAGQHCDALARCASDGRGWLDEAECRATPYHEPQQWACLAPERREAVGLCLSGSRCVDIEMCVRMAVCGPEGVCPAVLTTRLAVDCYRVCSAYEGGDARCPGMDFRTCYLQCDQAALRLADEHRRTYETCALDPVQCGADCLQALDCDAAPLVGPLEAVQARCGAQPELAGRLNQYACLGHVLQVAITACLEDAPCGDLAACVETAACGDTPDCLAFLAGR